MNYKPFLTIIWTLTAIAGVGQVVGAHSDTPRQGEMSANQIAHRATAAIAALGRDPGSIAKMWVSLETFVRGERRWDVLTEGKAHLARFDAISGELMSYYFQTRRYDQLKNRGRTGLQYFPNETAAKARIRAIATSLGVPASATMAGFEWKRDGQVKDQNSAGSVGAVFKDNQGRVIATVSCDPQDGVLVCFTRTRYP
jgi:hypothetical protein